MISPHYDFDLYLFFPVKDYFNLEEEKGVIQLFWTNEQTNDIDLS